MKISKIIFGIGVVVLVGTIGLSYYGKHKVTQELNKVKTASNSIVQDYKSVTDIQNANISKEDKVKELLRLMTKYEGNQNYASAIAAVKLAESYGYKDYAKDYKRLIDESKVGTNAKK